MTNLCINYYKCFSISLQAQCFVTYTFCNILFANYAELCKLFWTLPLLISILLQVFTQFLCVLLSFQVSLKKILSQQLKIVKLQELFSNPNLLGFRNNEYFLEESCISGNSQFHLNLSSIRKDKVDILPSYQLLWFLASIYLHPGFEPLISQR